MVNFTNAFAFFNLFILEKRECKSISELTIPTKTFWNGTEADDVKKFKIVEKLLAFPRASTKAELLLL